MRVLAFTKYDTLAASTRQRFRLYEPALAEAGIKVDYSPLLSNDHVAGLVSGKRANPLGVARSYARRLAALRKAREYDVIWLHCELFPYLPGFVELLATVPGRPVVYDCDDAIFHNYDASPLAPVRWLLGGKLEPLLRRVHAACCGNSYVQSYAARFCPRSIVLPTVVDTEAYRPASRSAGSPVTIGWIGSPSTWENVQPIIPLLRALHRDHGVRVRAVGAGAGAERDRFEGLELEDWSEEREIGDVQSFDIGIMPLLDQPFQRGKSGYKLVQYMACGLPVVASPIGVNSEIVADGENGLLATGLQEWRAALQSLILDPELRLRMGSAGRQRAVERYSLASQAPRLIEIFQSAYREKRR